MGIVGLWDLLKPYARPEGFDFLRNKRVAIDLSFWIVQHETAIQSHALNPHLRLTFFRTISLFAKFGAFPVFIVDGTPSPLKSQARTLRFFRSSGIEISTFPEHGSDVISVERNQKFTKHVKECVELLELLGMPVLKAKGEAEALCAQLETEGIVDACITADSDAFLFGAKCIIKCFNPNSKEPFECYHLSDIEAGLELTRKHLIAISLLVGNDHDLNGVQGIGLDTALRFVKGHSEEDIFNRLHEIGKGNIPLFQGESSPKTKYSHCSFCGHPGNKRAHFKLLCEYCGTLDGDGCIQKPEGFKCNCSSCDMDRKEKEQKKQDNWHIKVCNKIVTKPNFPNTEILQMYLNHDHGYISVNEGPCLSWGNPKTEMLVDFLSFYQMWNPSYIRQRMLPMLSTIFLRETAKIKTPTQTLLYGQYEFDSIHREKVRFGYQSYVIKWRQSSPQIASKESYKQEEDYIEEESDAPKILETDGFCFLLTDESIDLVQAAFPENVDRFLQEKELKRQKKTTPKKTESPKLLGVQLNITDFYRSSKAKLEAKSEDQNNNNCVCEGDGLVEEKRKDSSPKKFSKSARRRLLF